MRVAVFGAGYAGLTLARRLEESLPRAVELLVIADDDDHLVRHEIHRAIRRPTIADHLEIPLPDVLDRATIRRATVTDVDPESGVATIEGGDAPADGERIDYDVGAVCLGSETAYHDLPGVEANATPLTDLDDAAEIREDFLEVLDGSDEATVVVGGAGLTGVQIAGELATLARERDRDDAVEIRLLEQADAVAPSFPRQFQRAVEDALVERGVVVRTGADVESAGDAEIFLADDRSLAYDQFVWAGGISGPAALSGERPVVRSRLRLAGDTFVVGDAARVIDADGEAVPASAQAAVQEARVAAENVDRLVAHRTGERDGFEPRLANVRFDPTGWLVSVGDGAVAQVGGAVFTGPAAVGLKATVGAGYVTSIGSVRRAVDLAWDELGPSSGDGDETASDQPTSDDPVSVDVDPTED